MKVTGQDSFFITFLSTWMSVRLIKWGSGIFEQENLKGVIPLSIILISTLFFIIFINWLRDSKESREFRFEDFRFISSLIGFISCIGAMYYAHDNFLQLIDILVFSIIGLIWIISVITMEALNYDINIKVFLSKRSSRDQSKGV